MKDLGYEEVDCVVVDLDEKKEKALNIAFNKISGEWDNDLLANLFKDPDESGYDITLTGFDLAEAQELFGSGSMENVNEDDFDAETAIEEIAKSKTKRDDLWILEHHRTWRCSAFMEIKWEYSDGALPEKRNEQHCQRK